MNTSLASMTAFIKQFEDSSGIVLGAIIAVLGWLAQKYFSYMTEKYEGYRKAIQYAEMYRLRIKSSVESYTVEFNQATRLATEAVVRRKFRTKGKPALLIAGTSSKDMQDLLQREATKLPITITAPILDYYTHENLFDACYQLLASPAFQSSDLVSRLKCVDDCYAESDSCINAGRKSIAALDYEIIHHRNKLYVLLVMNLVVVLLSVHVVNSIIGLW
jgi:hypothetical protein